MLANGRLRDLQAETVVITGYLSSPRADFVRRVRRAGAVYSEDVTSATTLLVQGAPNALYAYRRASGEPYGTKLAEVDRQRRAGRRIAVITETELDDLLTGPGLTRAETDAAQRHATSLLGVPHRDGRRAGQRGAFTVEVDPFDVDRASQRHHRIVDQLAGAVRAAGLEPLDSNRRDAGYDLLWKKGRTTWLAEVKTISVNGRVRQVRYGSGQLLHHASVLQLSRDSKLVLLTDVPLPPGPLRDAPQRAGITVVHIDNLGPLRLKTTVG